MSTLIFYTTREGHANIDVIYEDETFWLNQKQLCELFGRDKSAISRHIRNIFKDGELDEISVAAKNATTAADGKTCIVDYYNLDMVIDVGYRVNSKEAHSLGSGQPRCLKSSLSKVLSWTMNV